MTIDPRTSRPVGDHGTAEQAILFVLGHNNSAWGQPIEFLSAWLDAELDEWPDFYVWLNQQDRP